MNTILEPIGKLVIIQQINNPIEKDTTPKITLKIVTCLKVFTICLADNTGNIINDVINKAPITFIPITIVTDVKTDIITFSNGLLNSGEYILITAGG